MWVLDSSSLHRLWATSDVDLELRSLPSTGVTRLRRYYEPLRHPRRPGLSLAGFRLAVTRRHRWGLPVFRVSPVSTCRRHYPGGTAGCLHRSLPQQHWPSPLHRRVASHIASFEACSAFTHVTARWIAEAPEGAHTNQSSEIFVSFHSTTVFARLYMLCPHGPSLPYRNHPLCPPCT